jgi:alkaline phosphatase
VAWACICLFCFLLRSFAASQQLRVRSGDLIRRLQKEAVESRVADWADWGPNPGSYSSWTSHTICLIPIYFFGADLNPVRGVNSPYRSEEHIRKVFGHVSEETLSRPRIL